MLSPGCPHAVARSCSSSSCPAGRSLTPLRCAVCPACAPCCCCCCQGSALNLVQDLPISKPLTAGEVNTLSGMVGVPTLCSFYGDIKGLTPRLAAAVDRMKALSSVVHLALCKVSKHMGCWHGQCVFVCVLKEVLCCGSEWRSHPPSLVTDDVSASLCGLLWPLPCCMPCLCANVLCAVWRPAHSSGREQRAAGRTV